MSSVYLRRLPRTRWLRLFVSTSGDCERSAGWYYQGILYRRAWCLGRIGFGWIWMPNTIRNKGDQ